MLYFSFLTLFSYRFFFQEKQKTTHTKNLRFILAGVCWMRPRSSLCFGTSHLTREDLEGCMKGADWLWGQYPGKIYLPILLSVYLCSSIALLRAGPYTSQYPRDNISIKEKLSHMILLKVCLLFAVMFLKCFSPQTFKILITMMH